MSSTSSLLDDVLQHSDKDEDDDDDTHESSTLVVPPPPLHEIPTRRRRHTTDGRASFRRWLRPRTRTADSIDVPTAAAAAAAGSMGRRSPTRPPAPDSSRRRLRWLRINRRFQWVITIVALLFSLLLFAILLAWVVLTSSYVVALESSCDVPLKAYFWLVTLQLVLDVFRSDILRLMLGAENSQPRTPVILVYNVAYLLYAGLVLRLGIRSVWIDETTCNLTAPQLFRASQAFVTLSIAAWVTIVFGYLLPFCVVAVLLTCNGYHPEGGSDPAVFPAAYSTSGAPPGCIDRLSVLTTVPIEQECCICMEHFAATDTVVSPTCQHVFHQQCCREWLRQARTCPVCRMDIPDSLETPPGDDENEEDVESQQRIPLGPTGRPVRGLWRLLQRGRSS